MNRASGAALAAILLAGSLTGLLPETVFDARGTHTIDPESFVSTHESLVLNAEALREQALALGNLNLRLFGKDYVFQLEPINDLAPSAKVTTLDQQGKSVPMPFLPIILFRATTTAGASGWLSLPGDWVQAEIVDGAETIYMEPRTRTDSPDAVETIVYRHSDMLPIPEVTAQEGASTETRHQEHGFAMSTIPQGPMPKPAVLEEAKASEGEPSGPIGLAKAIVEAQPNPNFQLLANLELAEAIQGHPSMEVADSIAIAKLATAWQASASAIQIPTIPTPPVHSVPSQAAFVLAARHGGSPDAAQLHKIRELDALPTAQADALMHVMEAFMALEDATAQAYANADTQGLQELMAQAHADASNQASVLQDFGLDFGPVLAARNALLDATQELLTSLPSVPLPQQTMSQSNPGINNCPAFAFDLDGIDTAYAADCALTIDVGGHDVYTNNAGGGSFLGFSTGRVHSAALIDLNGNDQYISGEFGVNGGGAHGTGFLLDAEGNDQYVGGNLGTNGGGTAGTGFLLDQSGDDHYTVENPPGTTAVGASNGGANVGLGLLIDTNGNDVYAGHTRGTNGGAELGVGFLLDQNGDDVYTAGKYSDYSFPSAPIIDGTEGANGGAYGGVGFLMDNAGNDTYSAAGSSGTNGGASLGGSGFLADQSGDDTYTATHNGTNGGGYFGGSGMLLDAKGNDTYTATHNGTNGGGYEGRGFLLDGGGDDLYTATSVGTNGGGSLGAGILIDQSGNDVYEADSEGTNGGGYLGSGFLLDEAGNDSYTAGSKGVNGGGLLGTGILLDLRGTDTYLDQEDGTGDDKNVIPKEDAGAQIDRDLEDPCASGVDQDTAAACGQGPYCPEGIVIANQQSGCIPIVCDHIDFVYGTCRKALPCVDLSCWLCIELSCWMPLIECTVDLSCWMPLIEACLESGVNPERVGACGSSFPIPCGDSIDVFTATVCGGVFCPAGLGDAMTARVCNITLCSEGILNAELQSACGFDLCPYPEWETTLCKPTPCAAGDDPCEAFCLWSSLCAPWICDYFTTYPGTCGNPIPLDPCAPVPDVCVSPPCGVPDEPPCADYGCQNMGYPECTVPSVPGVPPVPHTPDPVCILGNPTGCISPTMGGPGSPNYCSWGPFTPHILVDVDQQYVKRYGGMSWTNQVRTVINGVNEVYTPLCATHIIESMQQTSTVNSNDWDTAKNQWFTTTRPPSIDFMLHFTGRDFDGTTVGEADATPGRYTMNQQRGDCDFPHGCRGNALGDQIYIVRHELGHNHNGIHGQADYWYLGDGEHRTIMGAAFSGIIENFFSHGNEPCSGVDCRDPVRDPAHNNRKRIHDYIIANGR